MKLMSEEKSANFNRMFECEAPQAFTAEDLAEICLKNKARDETESYTLELTINCPPSAKEYKKLSLLAKIEYYKALFDAFCKEHNAGQSQYIIEYCRSGNPHLHAYVNVKIPSKIMFAGTEELLRMFARFIFLQLPRTCFKQFATAKIDERLKVFTSPAVHINMKDYLSQGWVDYMNKTQK